MRPSKFFFVVLPLSILAVFVLWIIYSVFVQRLIDEEVAARLVEMSNIDEFHAAQYPKEALVDAQKILDPDYPGRCWNCFDENTLANVNDIFGYAWVAGKLEYFKIEDSCTAEIICAKREGESNDIYYYSIQKEDVPEYLLTTRENFEEHDEIIHRTIVTFATTINKNDVYTENQRKTGHYLHWSVAIPFSRILTGGRVFQRIEMNFTQKKIEYKIVGDPAK